MIRESVQNSGDFGQYLRELRVQKGITQQEMSELMYVSRKTIGNWESGRTLPDIISLTRLAQVLETDISFFLTFFTEES